MRFPRRARTGGSAAVPRAILITCLLVTSSACPPTTEVARLQAEVRRLQAAVDEAQKREAETQVRLQELRDKAAGGAAQAGAAAPAETPRGAVEKPPAGASPHEMYNAAFTRYNLGQHLEAIQLFHSFIAAYPK